MILSTLTKILIVLLTLSSVFLCGIIVTYVANAQDYKKEAKELRGDLNRATQSEKAAKDQLAEYHTKSEGLQTTLKNKIASLEKDISTIANQLTSTKRERDNLVVKVTNMAAEVESLSEKAIHQTDLYNSAEANRRLKSRTSLKT
jgi:predicted nuclease with TOPRIM domain